METVTPKHSAAVDDNNKGSVMNSKGIGIGLVALVLAMGGAGYFAYEQHQGRLALEQAAIAAERARLAAEQERAAAFLQAMTEHVGFASAYVGRAIKRLTISAEPNLEDKALAALITTDIQDLEARTIKLKVSGPNASANLTAATVAYLEACNNLLRSLAVHQQQHVKLWAYLRHSREILPASFTSAAAGLQLESDILAIKTASADFDGIKRDVVAAADQLSGEIEVTGKIFPASALVEQAQLETLRADMAKWSAKK
jgi:hypothetical protein